MKKPIHPKDLLDSIPSSFPEIIIEAVNNILIKNYSRAEIKMNKNDIETEIKKILQFQINTVVLLSEICDLFNKFGWDVVYQKPQNDEDIIAYLSFTARK